MDTIPIRRRKLCSCRWNTSVAFFVSCASSPHEHRVNPLADRRPYPVSCLPVVIEALTQIVKSAQP
ncbi:hypothetical protein EI94DRAFT_1725109, partial [Lactarius quietus]